MKIYVSNTHVHSSRPITLKTKRKGEHLTQRRVTLGKRKKWEMRVRKVEMRERWGEGVRRHRCHEEDKKRKLQGQHNF